MVPHRYYIFSKVLDANIKVKAPGVEAARGNRSDFNTTSGLRLEQGNGAVDTPWCYLMMFCCSIAITYKLNVVGIYNIGNVFLSDVVG